MANRFELIVFDWDGTLLDSAAAIVAAIQSAAGDLGLPVPDEARARHVIGLGLEDALSYAVPDLPRSDYPRMAERYRLHYLARDHELRLFPGAFELVTDLHRDGRLLGVATGKSRRGLDRALAASGLAPFIAASRCADECHAKPHPQMLHELMDTFGVPAGRTLMIGDTSHDIGMARSAGCGALAVGFGAHPEAVLVAARPDALCRSVAELRQWLADHA